MQKMIVSNGQITNSQRSNAQMLKIFLFLFVLFSSIQVIAAPSDCITRQTRCNQECIARQDLECVNQCTAAATACVQQEKTRPSSSNNNNAGRENPASQPQSVSGGCFGALSGVWKHPVGGTWEFNGNSARMVLNSTNYGAAAQQITELSISSCDNNVMTYKIVRAALINTVDPSMAYDKTPENAPNQSAKWNKVHRQGYSISPNALKFGNYTYNRQ